jgi:hypothetical protein
LSPSASTTIPFPCERSEEPGDFQDLVVVVSVSDYEAVAAAADEFACVNAAAVDEDHGVSSPPWRLVIINQDFASVERKDSEQEDEDEEGQ